MSKAPTQLVLKDRVISNGQVPTQEQVDERHNLFGRYASAYANRSGSVPAELQDEPEFDVLRQERAACHAAIAHEAKLHDELVKRNQKARAKHQKNLEWAMETSNPLPPPFVPEEWPGMEFTGPFWDQKFNAINMVEQALMNEHITLFSERVEKKSARARDRLGKAEADLAAARSEYAPYEEALAALARIAQPVRHAGEVTDFQVTGY